MDPAADRVATDIIIAVVPCAHLVDHNVTILITEHFQPSLHM